jgi:hypothetical protein
LTFVVMDDVSIVGSSCRVCHRRKLVSKSRSLHGFLNTRGATASYLLSINKSGDQYYGNQSTGGFWCPRYTGIPALPRSIISGYQKPSINQTIVTHHHLEPLLSAFICAVAQPYFYQITVSQRTLSNIGD